MKIQQAAGRIELTAWTDGWPIMTDLAIAEQSLARLDLNELHALRFCVERVIAQIAQIEEYKLRQLSQGLHP